MERRHRVPLRLSRQSVDRIPGIVGLAVEGYPSSASTATMTPPMVAPRAYPR